MTTKSEQRPVTRKDVAAWLDISVPTLKGWDRRFAAWLESPPGKQGSARKREYTENDLLVLATIKRLRNKNISLDEIESILDEEIGKTPPLEWGRGEETTELTTVNQLTRQIITISADLAASEATKEAITEERDRLLEEVKESRQEATDARERATAAEVELKILKELTEQKPPEGEKLTWWQRVFGRKG